MKKSCKFYSGIPGFKIVYGGSNGDKFTSFNIGEDITMYLNLELRTNTDITTTHVDNRRNFGRIIFHTEALNVHRNDKERESGDNRTILAATLATRAELYSCNNLSSAN